MGACDLSLTFDGDLSESEVIAKVDAVRIDDLAEFGHQDGYSGSWTTIPSIVFRHKTFPNQREAYDYCLDEAEKWEYAIAVKYVSASKTLWLVCGWAAS